MAKGIKIAFPGVNALTDTNPKNFSLYVDGTTNHILIKEKTRGVESVASGGTDNISHGLGYFPFAMVMIEEGTDYKWAFGNNAFDGYRAWATTSNLVLKNNTADARNFFYYIFYDQL